MGGWPIVCGTGLGPGSVIVVRMKLLYVAESIPNRDPLLGDGSSMIPYEVVLALPAEVGVTLLTFRSDVAVPPEILRRCDDVIVLPVRSGRTALARSIVSKLQVGAEERASSQARSQVQRWSVRTDGALLHGPHVMFLAHQVQGPVVIQSVDPWSLRIGMESRLAHGWRAAYRRRKARQALAVERSLPPRARLLTVGAEDARSWSLEIGRQVRSIPNGVEPTSRPPRVGGPPVVCFTGSLNYGPNIDSAQILITTIAPRVWHHMPDTKFVIAGRQPGPDMLALAGERVEIQANVASMTDVFHGADVAVFPDEHGLGIRNSVGEALASGLPVVATPEAAREQPGHRLLSVLANKEDMVARILELLRAALDNSQRDSSSICAQAHADEWRTTSLPPAETRTWHAVALDYLAELTAAGASATLTGRRRTASNAHSSETL